MSVMATPILLGVLLCVLVRSSPARGFVWDDALPDGSELSACVGSSVTFPWAVVLGPGETEEGHRWTRQLSHDAENTTAADKLFPAADTNAFTFEDRFEFGPGALLRISKIKVTDTGLYTYTVYVRRAGTRVAEAKSNTVSLQVMDPPAASSRDPGLHTDGLATQDPEGNWKVPVRCGPFSTPGTPLVTPYLVKPFGARFNQSTLSSQNFVFLLDAKDDSGLYYCGMPDYSPAVRCLPRDSPLFSIPRLKIVREDIISAIEDARRLKAVKQGAAATPQTNSSEINELESFSKELGTIFRKSESSLNTQTPAAVQFKQLVAERQQERQLRITLEATMQKETKMRETIEASLQKQTECSKYIETVLQTETAKRQKVEAALQKLEARLETTLQDVEASLQREKEQRETLQLNMESLQADLRRKEQEQRRNETGKRRHRRDGERSQDANVIFDLLNTKVAFSAFMNYGDSYRGGISFKWPYTAVFTKVILNLGNAYNSVTGNFTAPISGLYVFAASFGTLPDCNGQYTAFQILANETRIAYSRTRCSTSLMVMTEDMHGVAYMNKGERACVQATNNEAVDGVTSVWYDTFTFQGFLLQPDL